MALITLVEFWLAYCFKLLKWDEFTSMRLSTSSMVLSASSIAVSYLLLLSLAINVVMPMIPNPTRVPIPVRTKGAPAIPSPSAATATPPNHAAVALVAAAPERPPMAALWKPFQMFRPVPKLRQALLWHPPVPTRLQSWLLQYCRWR